MNDSLLFKFDLNQMPIGGSHGGVGNLLAHRVAGVLDWSFVRHIDLVVLAPLASIAPHRHENDNEEIYVIIRGGGMMQVEEEQFQVSVGHVIRNLPNGLHGFVNTGIVDVWIVVIEIAVPTGVNP